MVATTFLGLTQVVVAEETDMLIETKQPITVNINGRVIDFLDQNPQVIHGRTLVPMRKIFEELGATISWDDATKTVTANKGDIIIKLTIGNKKVNVNGVGQVLDVPGTIVSGRTMVPLRFVSEGLKSKVDWDSGTRTVVIVDGNKPHADMEDRPVLKKMLFESNFNVNNMNLMPNVEYAGITNGRYFINGIAEDKMLEIPIGNDYWKMDSIRFTVYPEEMNNGAEFGVKFNRNGASGYEFRYNQSQKQTFSFYNIHKGAYGIPVKTVDAPSLKIGSSYAVEVLIKRTADSGALLTLTIDGKEIMSVKDDRLPSGSFSWVVNHKGTFSFDNLTITGIEDETKYFQSGVNIDFLTNKVISDSKVTWKQFGPGMAGYNESFFYHSTDPDAIYITPDMHPSYRSLDNGKSWTKMVDSDRYYNEISRAGSIEFSRQDENFGVAANRFGIYFTYDKGASWIYYQDIPTDLSKGLNEISALAFDYYNDNTIYVGGGDFWNIKNNGTTISKPHRVDPKNTGKIWRSDDRGKTFKLINNGIHPSSEIGKIYTDPYDTTIVYAATTRGLYKSINKGDNWTLCTNGLGNNNIADMALHYDKASKVTTIYVIDDIQYASDGNGGIVSKGGIYKSTDRCASFENVTSDLYLDFNRIKGQNAVNFYWRAISDYMEVPRENVSKVYPKISSRILQRFNRIVVNPKNVNEVYLAANAEHSPTLLPGDLWKSNDGGKNWFITVRSGISWETTDVNYWMERGNPTDQNIRFNHADSKYLNNSYFDAGLRTLAINSRGDVYIGLGQTQHLSADGGRTWISTDETETSVGSNNWVGAGNSNLPGRYIVQGNNDTYFLSGEHNLWALAADGDSVYKGAQAVKHLFNAPINPSSLAIDPMNENNLYILVNRLKLRGQFLKSTDKGNTWEYVSTPVPNIKDQAIQQSLTVLPIKGSDKQMIMFCIPAKVINDVAKTYNGKEMSDPHIPSGFYISFDSGVTWSIRNSGLPKSASVNNFVIDPRDGKTIYASLLEDSGERGGLYKSVNFGETWNPVEIPTQIKQVNYVHIDQKAPYKIYIGSGIDRIDDIQNSGLYTAQIETMAWTKISDLPAVLRVTTDATDPKRIMFISGSSNGPQAFGFNRNPGLYLSEDGGSSFIKINRGIALPEKFFDMKFDLKDKDILWCTTRGSGFYKAKITRK
jgi:hypothetical protein